LTRKTKGVFFDYRLSTIEFYPNSEKISTIIKEAMQCNAMEFIRVAIIDNPQFTIDKNMWFLTILISYCKPTKIKITINKKNYISLRAMLST